MVVVTNNWRVWLAGTTLSLVVFLIVYFVAIKPETNTANQALKSGLQETQQVVKQAQKQLGSAAVATGAAGAAGSAGAASTIAAGQKQLSKAAKLTACIVAAGTDVSKVQICQSRYAG
jgi:hypothetical protein